MPLVSLKPVPLVSLEPVPLVSLEPVPLVSLPGPCLQADRTSRLPIVAGVTLLVDGIRGGFWTGFVANSVSLVSARRNMLSTSGHPSGIEFTWLMRFRRFEFPGLLRFLRLLVSSAARLELSPRRVSRASGTSSWSLHNISVGTAITALVLSCVTLLK